MLKILGGIAILWACFACESEPKKVIDFSSKIPKSTRNYDSIPSDENGADSISRRFPYRSMFGEIKEIKAIESAEFIDRFRPVSTEKYTLFFDGQDSLQFMRWTFKDSMKTKSAFYNWLDHYEVAYFGSKENILKPSFSLLYSDTAIVLLTGVGNFKEWRTKITEKEWLGENDCLIEQRKQGKARWYQWKAEEFIEIQEE